MGKFFKEKPGSREQNGVIPGTEKESKSLLKTVLKKEAEAATEVNGDSPGRDPHTFTPPDGGWGWVVCFASFWTNGTLFGILNTFGILYVYILEEHDNGQDKDIAFKTSWIGSLQITMTFLMSPIASVLVDRLGIRTTAFVGSIIAIAGMLASSFVSSIPVLYFTYGIMLGLGSSLVYTPSLAILGHYFRAKLGIVNGLVAFGSAVFTMALPFILKECLETIGRKHTMRVLTALYATLLLCVFTWKPLYSTKHRELDHYLTSNETTRGRIHGCVTFIKKFLNFKIWKNKGYIVWAIALPVSFLGYFIPFVHLPKHTKDILPGSNPEILVMCLGATTGISRLVCGKLADFPWVNRVRMQQAAFFVLGVATACIPFAKQFWGLVLIVLVMGICDGCFICLLGPIAFDLLGPAGAAQGIGCLLGLMSFPMTAGPPIAGLVYDHLHSYDIAFWAAGAPPILGACILFLMPYKQQYVPQVTLVESTQAMSVQNLDKIGTEEEEPLWNEEQKENTMGGPVIIHRPKVEGGGYAIPVNAGLNNNLTMSVPNLTLENLKKRNISVFSSLPHLVDGVKYDKLPRESVV